MDNMKTTDLKKVYFVSHTHWDREWYLPKESFRFMLGKVVDRLIDILDEDEGHYAFMLDGQTIALRDYLKIRPENEFKLKKYIEQGRILIGPWFILPDELLISGEAHIRNYIIGSRLCEEFGGNLNMGYLPDSFGHPSQMPQIIKGLGMSEIIFWRGLGPEVDKTEFIWLGPDGSEILAVNMPLGYGVGACLPEDREHFKRRLWDTLGKLSKMTDTKSILFMNGVDHVAPQKFVPQYIRDFKYGLDGFELLHSSLPEYLESIKSFRDKLQKFKGELRSPKRAYLLAGTVSARMYLKQANYRAEQNIEKWVEPIATMAAIMGKAYPSGEINLLWEKLLENLPHDSICGCSIDEVHDEMMMRYRNIRQLCEDVLNDAFRYIAGRVPANQKHDGSLLVFNPLGHERNDIVNAVIDVNEQLVRKVDYDTSILTDYPYDREKALPVGVKVYDARGNKMKSALNSAQKVVDMKISLEKQPEMFEVQRLDISFIADGLPSVGYSLYYFDLVYEDKKEEDMPGTTIENEYFKILPLEDGSINIYDKVQDKYYYGCNRLVDTGDAGDEYTYSPPLNDFRVDIDKDSAAFEIVENSAVRQSLKMTGRMNIPEKLCEDRKNRSSETIKCEVSSVITLYPGIRRIDVKTKFDNKAEDHRLRVLFPTGIHTGNAYTEGTFIVDKREIVEGIKIEDYSDWIELPGNVYPQKSFVDVNDGREGFMVANRAVTECEILKDNSGYTIALTLLRCVGWLSRGDLLFRKGNAGWMLPTPGAQCKGEYEFEYSIIPHEKDWNSSRAFMDAHDFNTPLRAVLKTDHTNEEHNPTESWIGIDDPSIIVSALKKAESGDDVVLRMFNISGSRVDANIKLNFGFSSAKVSNLKEEAAENIKNRDSTLQVSFKPHEIVTLIISK